MVSSLTTKIPSLQHRPYGRVRSEIRGLPKRKIASRYRAQTRAVVLSPGRARQESGLCLNVSRERSTRRKLKGSRLRRLPRTPALGEVSGARCQGGQIMHGKTYMARHDGRGVFEGVPTRFARALPLACRTRRRHPGFVNSRLRGRRGSMGCRHKRCRSRVQFQQSRS